MMVEVGTVCISTTPPTSHAKKATFIMSEILKIYEVSGCEECVYNDTFYFKEKTLNGDTWWVGIKSEKFLRHSPNFGWTLGWYTNSDKGTIAPKDGWTFMEGVTTLLI
jgi:hypothetical protein